MSYIESAIGKSPPRLEAAEKAAGQALFSGDMVMPGMLHGALLTSPHAHARILSYDATAALALPGVRAVVTAEDITGGAIGPLVRDEHALARGKVRYIGEPVAAVAAESEAVARLAARLVEVEYEELPAVATIAEAMAEGAPLLHEDFADYFKIYPAPENGGNLMTRGEAVMGRGVEGFDEADIVVEEEFRFARHTGVTLEPRCIIADYDPSTHALTVHQSHQAPHEMAD
ncbi:MAG: molybdopterin-dependent oxidoreductase, partial [Alphaproteobacteria bacterium]|nr:molybdopterin-dependent oxidoreductase [Alphaproteobacteria bacterium]